jgi:DNA-directed RNA polymerase specialized sigma24 family protein
MSSPGSVTLWINQLKAGDRDAAQPLWEGYFLRLVGLARKKLRATPRRAADEEDVALSAFDSFCRAAERGRFSQLEDRHDLWQILVVLTARKACDLVRHEERRKPKDGVVLDEAALAGPSGSSVGEAGLEQLVGAEPTPALAAELVEECRRLLDQLGEDELRKIALLKMEGFTDKEVAVKRKCGLRTVERKLERIRRRLEKEIAG